MPRNNSKARREQRQATAKSAESDIMVARRRMTELQDAWVAKMLAKKWCTSVHIPVTREFGPHNDHVHECCIEEHSYPDAHHCSCGFIW